MNNPSSLVEAPTLVPLSTMFAAGTGSPVLALYTSPIMIVSAANNLLMQSNRHTMYAKRFICALRFLSVSRVILKYCVAQILNIQMCVDLGSRNAFVPEHLLYESQVRSVLQQVCGKRVAQRVRRDRFADTRLCRQSFDDSEDHCTGQSSSVAVEEGIILVIGFDIQV